MQIVIDTAHDNPEQIRRAARFLYVLAGPAADAPVDPQGTETAPSVPEPSRAYIPPPPPSNVVNFPPPPPPPPEDSARLAAEQITRFTDQVAPRVAATDYPVDSAGMPWDARIHQEKKTKKKDGTWKIKKGLDQKILQAVVAELAAARGPANTTPPPAPAMVPLPPGVPPAPAPVSANTAVSVPVAPTVLPARVHTGAVPAPPTLSASDVSAYRVLMDKISDATITGKLEPGVVHNIIQRAGVPNLQALYAMPHLIPDVNTSINLALSGFHT